MIDDLPGSRIFRRVQLFGHLQLAVVVHKDAHFGLEILKVLLKGLDLADHVVVDAAKVASAILRHPVRVDGAFFLLVKAAEFLHDEVDEFYKVAL